ncbi:lytic transglycosylase domain-containing protein [Acidithiobacillus sp. MC6.1]|nr:lytic transglycosylase domain-containing protein [Acidithiobacillus sp. MC6.1]
MIPFTTLAAQCAPESAPTTMAAIVRVESRGNPLAMYDNNTGQEITPPNLPQAVTWLRAAIALGQRVDVGIAQVDTENFTAYGLTPENAFDPCTNLSVGAKILLSDYRKAVTRYGPGQIALYHAFQAYNSGHLIGDPGYANRILAAAGIPVSVQQHGVIYRLIHHYHDPFTYHWKTSSGESVHVDMRYRGSASGLSLTHKWG